ncbi:MAG TPA: hypothetical protein VFI40_04930 [Nocardioides sp.]|nr:hypothetical protein [Nocardioides sp.]
MKAVLARLKAAFLGLPAGVRVALRDMVEAAIAAVMALTFFIPTNLADAKSEGEVVYFAVLAAIVAVARRELLPAIKAYIVGLFGA